MHGHFFEAFGKKDNESRIIPNDILEELNKRLPKNFKYVRRSDGNYEAIPDPDSSLEEMVFNIELDLENEPDLKKIYTDLGPVKFAEYINRAQKVVPAKKCQIGTSGQLESIEKLSTDPFSDEECKITDAMLFASRFEEPIKMRFESPEGDVAQIDMQQVKYDSLTEIKRENVSFPALKIEIYQYSPLTDQDAKDAHTSADHQIKIQYGVTPSKAASVHEAVIALHIFRGLVDGTTKINNTILSPQGAQLTSKPVQLESSVAFWETALKLENKLNVSFDPSISPTNEEIQLFTELDVCMLQGKTIMWKHPFDHFRVGGYRTIAGGGQLTNLVGSDGINYTFIEGPIPAKLLGATFDIYSKTILSNFKITNIEWNEETDEGELYITDSDDNPWILSRHYCSKQEATEFRKEIDKIIECRDTNKE